MKVIRKFIDYLLNPDVDFQTRIFALLTAIGIVGETIVLIGDVSFGENITEIIILAVSVALVPVICIISIRFDRVRTGTMIIVIGIIFVILPVSFFFGGGPKGGGIIWMAFCYLYVGIILDGMRRYIMLTLHTVFIVCEYFAAYYNAGHIYPHITSEFYFDSALSVVVVGFVIFTMVLFQNRLYIDENRRAKGEAAKVEELNRAQNRFFSNMSHEIRTPINTILGLNELILRREDASEEVISDARNIEGAGRMLLAIVNDILDMSRLESGSMDLVPVSYHIGDLLSEIVNMLWSKTEEKGLGFKIDVDPSTPCELFGDEVRIKQILINLLTNAIKYTKEGTIGLYVECEQEGDNEVILTFAVTDTGMGIKKEAIPHLFDAFKRIDEEKNRNIEGTGLGLSIVKQLVDLMDGTITVSSVYMQGSTFEVKLRQDIVDPKAIGNLVIGAGAGHDERSDYKQSFEAPEADILIVDDNELNLKVESKLLSPTRVNTDTAMSGAQALNMSLEKHYDLILMDHLMPEMDGVECLRKLKEQAGGLNRNTPVIVLTANAGSENQELYRTSGFDGYLSKPVSGTRLETALLNYLPKEKIILNNAVAVKDEGFISTGAFDRKDTLAVTTSSMCDLPASFIRDMNIGVIPYKIVTEEGVFWDGSEIVSSEAIRYIERSGAKARMESPEVADFERFFAWQLTKARRIIHITAAAGTFREYERAIQAASAFGNVIVIDSGVLAASSGMMVMAACRLMQQGYGVDDIAGELDALKKKLYCTYIIDSTKYMAMAGHISERLNRLFRSFMIHPMIRMTGGKTKVKRIWVGARESVWRRYIDHVLTVNRDIDTDIVFINYVDLNEDELRRIEERVRKHITFRRVVFLPSSSATVLNCGPGVFGILYMKTGSRSYNLSALIQDDLPTDQGSARGVHEDYNFSGYDESRVNETVENGKDEEGRLWYNMLDGIDGTAGIDNCGSEDSYVSVLKIFFDGIDSKAKELSDFFASEEWNDYMIKVHAVKSSARIIGADELADEALGLENAAKAGDHAYITEHHEGFIRDYIHFKEVLSKVCRDSDAAPDTNAAPMADDYLIEGMYDAVREAAREMDIDAIESAIKELDGYMLPDAVKDKLDRILDMTDIFDYDGIVELLDER